MIQKNFKKRDWNNQKLLLYLKVKDHPRKMEKSNNSLMKQTQESM